MLAVALPELRREFDVGHAEVGWLVSAYLIAMAVAQPLGGRLGDQLGRSRVFRGGLVAFLVLSIGAALAPTFPVLILLRTGQALVGAAVIPNGMAMLRESVPVDRLGMSSGFIGSAMSIAAATGPLLGAALLAAGSWRLLFLMNVPLVLLALAAFALLRYQSAPAMRRWPSLDWAGALVFAALLVSVTFVLNSLRGSQGTYAFAAGVACLVVFGAVFFQRQRTSAVPIAEWSLFRNRSYAGATAFILLNNLVMYTTLLSVPFFIEEVQGKGSGPAGLLLGIMSVTMALVSPIGGRISDSAGRRLPVFAGSLCVVVAVVALLTGLDASVTFGYLAVSLALMGLGVGLSSAANAAAIESAPRELAGAASGTNSMMRYLGSIIGTGVLGAVLNSQDGAPDVDVFQFMFAVLLVMAVLSSLSSLFIHRFSPELNAARRAAATVTSGPPEAAVAPALDPPG
jgi:MFS family permease